MPTQLFLSFFDMTIMLQAEEDRLSNYNVYNDRFICNFQFSIFSYIKI
jgi:hypothetical protein